MDCDKRKPPWRVETRVEKWVEEEKEVARYLLANMQKPGMEIYLIFLQDSISLFIERISNDLNGFKICFVSPPISCGHSYLIPIMLFWSWK